MNADQKKKAAGLFEEFFPKNPPYDAIFGADGKKTEVNYVIYGGDWGVRLRPTESLEDWSIEDTDQYGETHLVLSDEDDIMFAD